MAGIETDRVLFLCEDTTTIAAFVRLFEANGFKVDRHAGRLRDVDLSRYGAVVHIAHTADALNIALGDELANIRDKEWIMLGGSAYDEDCYCTVQLTPHASDALQSFVRTLWAQFVVT